MDGGPADAMPPAESKNPPARARLNGTLRGWVRTLRGFKSIKAGNRALTILQAVYNMLRPHQGLGGLTPFQAAGGGGLTWVTLAKAL